jgi:hypothetical protein
VGSRVRPRRAPTLFPKSTAATPTLRSSVEPLPGHLRNGSEGGRVLAWPMLTGRYGTLGADGVSAGCKWRPTAPTTSPSVGMPTANETRSCPVMLDRLAAEALRADPGPRHDGRPRPTGQIFSAGCGADTEPTDTNSPASGTSLKSPSLCCQASS